VIASTGSQCQVSNGGCALDLQNLAGGSYQVIVSGPTVTNSDVLSFSAVLSQDVSATLAANTPITVNLPNPGQTATLSFSGTAGETPSIQATSVTTTPFNAYIFYYLYTPSGGGYYSYVYEQGNLNWTWPALPSTGTYTIYLVPYNSASGAATYSGQVELVP
jgi:large repetitive protein